MMERRSFAQLSVLGGLGLFMPLHACGGQNGSAKEPSPAPFKVLTASLLRTWCDAMLATQINEPENAALHGALYCDACNRIHGRCMDAVYPFLYMADTTGEQKYLNAAIDVMKWSENVSKADGSWTVVPNPKSWSGITVFGAIALAEALHHHGHILDEKLRKQWAQRLEKAADFVHRNFTIDYSHINYPMTAVYGLHLWGQMFSNEAYLEHAKELASQFHTRLTKPNNFIFGENNPSDKPSEKGLYPVDLGYNVEETLNGVVQYAVTTKEEELLRLVQKSMESHLEFMLPDGAWDNSWGTRQNKWSYWGSRTTDGCQPAFALMANRNKAFGTAAYLSTELLERCTVNGLLAGGLHYGHHNVLPCLHHSFAHAKSLAFVLDNYEDLPTVTKEEPLPRTGTYGIKEFTDLAVWLVSKGPWRATVSANDVVFKKPDSQTATGGSLAILWHQDIGPVFTASMAEYLMVEPFNQQQQPDEEDIPLTPRVEVFKDNQWFTNLYDRNAQVETKEEDVASVVLAKTLLTNKEQQVLDHGQYLLTYRFEDAMTTITAQNTGTAGLKTKASLILPVILSMKEKVKRISPQELELHKEGGMLKIVASGPITIMETKRDRTFNMVPGMQALPLRIDFGPASPSVQCTLTVA
ncbi:hypothetical protein [Maribacter sp. 2307ULW6-5]|uniref:hypothetical protein n=1 Tax=Maribacter sp. 2307ULW6-5 TaxID=3386275 RepID=UPI0039BC78DF